MGRFLTGAALLALLLPGPGEAGAVRLERTPWAERFPDDIDWVLAVDDSLGAQWTRRLSVVVPTTPIERTTPCRILDWWKSGRPFRSVLRVTAHAQAAQPKKYRRRTAK